MSIFRKDYDNIELWHLPDGRYVTHFLTIDKDYNEALWKSSKYNGKEYKARWYGGGIVFRAMSPEHVSKLIKLARSHREMDKIYGWCSDYTGNFHEVGRTEHGAKISATLHGAKIVGYRSPINNMFIETATKSSTKWIKSGELK